MESESRTEHTDTVTASLPSLVAQAHDLSSGCPTALPSVKPVTAFYKSAQWTADGTCIITNSSDQKVRTYVVPPELLDAREEPLDLVAYSVITYAESTDAVTTYPFFDLQNPATCLILAATNEHPISLRSALTSDLLASYPLVNETTEAFTKPKSLCFTLDGTGFLAGSENRLSRFDLSRPGSEAVTSYKTGPKHSRATWANPSTSLRGSIAALALDPQYKILAAGTYSRSVGLYDLGGQGDCIGAFSVQGTAADEAIGGGGVTQVVWSPCGRYLFIVERRTQGIMFYDIRKSGQLLGWMEGRAADTNQRISVDIQITEHSKAPQFWSGGTDGNVRVWTEPQLSAGAIMPSDTYHLHTDVVGAVTMHHGGSVLATVSGQRSFDATACQAQLRLWSLDG